jgi:hypothetical protein
MSASEHACVQRYSVARPIVGEKLALEACNVHTHRTLGLAGAALKTQVKYAVDTIVS